MWKYSSQKMMFWGVRSRKARVGGVFCIKWVVTASVDKQEPWVACVLAWGGSAGFVSHKNTALCLTHACPGSVGCAGCAVN